MVIPLTGEVEMPFIVRSEIMDCIDDPATSGEDAIRYFKDGALVVDDGKVENFGSAEDIMSEYSGLDVVEYKNKLIIPGMIDTHIHFPQTEMIASYGEQLLTWLTEYAFPTEKQFESYEHASEIADFFIKELLKNGTTTALVFGTVHPQSVDAFFAKAQDKKLRMIAGKAMMNRNCPDYLQDTVDSGYNDSKALIEKWHGVDRLSYAVTPRFAVTSTPEQLESCALLLEEYPGLYLHTHLSENVDECDWIKKLYPDSKDYLGVYEDAGLVGKRSVFAHGIYLSDRELNCLSENGAAISHCPTSNLFIGSGLFNLKSSEAKEIKVGVGTDVGGGSSFSMLQSYNEAYKIQQLQNNKLSPYKGLYLNTLGGAKALDLEGTIGNFQIGCEADFVVLDYAATPLIELRLNKAKTIHEKLFALMMLGDDRAIFETWALGEKVHSRDH